jgi:phenylpyruvate tautomerase PptA (4-oxalocrotonate tautomerase family)
VVRPDVPLVRIDAPTADPARLDALGEAVHAALVEAFAIPPDDRFQVQRGASGDRVVFDRHYLGVERGEDFVLVQVFLRAGRTDEQKRRFYAALADGVAALGLDPRDLMVVLTENGLADWSFGNGDAQYI